MNIKYNNIVSEYKEWIQNHTCDHYNMLVDENVIKLETEYALATINFVQIQDSVVVEFNIFAKKDDATKFYLHFELNDYEHAKQLFYEMNESLINLGEEKTTKILLCCSAGLTTSMLVEELNNAIKHQNIDYEFKAISYMNIHEEEKNYDIILLAPQVGYMLKQLQESIPNKLLLEIPTSLFATYDVLGILQLLQSEVAIYNQIRNDEKNTQCIKCVKSSKKILAVAIEATKNKTKIHYQLINEGTVIESDFVIKPTLNIYDLCDVVDIALLKHTYIDLIAVATPGIIENGNLFKDPINCNLTDMKKVVKEKYDIDIFICNDVNAAVEGFALEYPEFNNYVYHFQPDGFVFGGQGIICNGQLVNGYNGMSGEIKYFIRSMQFSDEINRLIETRQGMVEFLTKSILPTISLTGPEVIIISSPMIMNCNEIKQNIAKHVDCEHVPEFYYIKEPSANMLNGVAKLANDYIIAGANKKDRL